MAIRAADLNIGVEIDNAGSKVRLSWTSLAGEPRGETLEGHLTLGALAEKADGFSRRLDSFMEGVTLALGCDEKMDRKRPATAEQWGLIDKAVRDLHNWAAVFTYNLVGERNVARLEDACRQAWRRGWRAPGATRLIEFNADLQRVVPLAFLPLFDRRPPAEITDPRSLWAALRRFAGFAAIIKRNAPGISSPQESGLDDEPRLRVKFFQHGELTDIRKELDYLKKHRRVEVDGPWPSGPLAPPPAQLVAEYLADPRLRFNGRKRSPPDQIQHFSCHCFTSLTPSDNNCLTLSADGSDEYDVTVGDLQYHLATRDATAPLPEILPLVFLNACGSSVIKPEGAGFFPLFFLRRGNRGVIGTETNIPQAFAAAFSIQCYKHLLSGMTLGDALHKAKWTMLERFNNPLGILYTLYADPDIHLCSKRPRARAPRAATP